MGRGAGWWGRRPRPSSRRPQWAALRLGWGQGGVAEVRVPREARRGAAVRVDERLKQRRHAQQQVALAEGEGLGRAEGLRAPLMTQGGGDSVLRWLAGTTTTSAPPCASSPRRPQSACTPMHSFSPSGCSWSAGKSAPGAAVPSQRLCSSKRTRLPKAAPVCPPAGRSSGCWLHRSRWVGDQLDQPRVVDQGVGVGGGRGQLRWGKHVWDVQHALNLETIALRRVQGHGEWYGGKGVRT